MSATERFGFNIVEEEDFSREPKPLVDWQRNVTDNFKNIDNNVAKESDVNELKLKTADSGWIAIEPVAGEASTGRYAPQYRKIGNKVYLRGYIAEIGEEGTLVFTLPSGYRPTSRIRVLSVGDTLDTTMSICRILEDGRIFMFKTNSTSGYLNLDGISFLTD